nr:uncharacterized protein LOC111993817 [Quercus suber]
MWVSAGGGFVWFDGRGFVLTSVVVFLITNLLAGPVCRELKATMESQDRDEIHNCVIKLRVNPQKRREKVYIGCGAGFGGDRPMAALKLLQRVKELNYLVLECLAERTLAERNQFMVSGGDGYDSWSGVGGCRIVPVVAVVLLRQWPVAVVVAVMVVLLLLLPMMRMRERN